MEILFCFPCYQNTQSRFNIFCLSLNNNLYKLLIVNDIIQENKELWVCGCYCPCHLATWQQTMEKKTKIILKIYIKNCYQTVINSLKENKTLYYKLKKIKKYIEFHRCTVFKQHHKTQLNNSQNIKPVCGPQMVLYYHLVTDNSAWFLIPLWHWIIASNLYFLVMT